MKPCKFCGSLIVSMSRDSFCKLYNVRCDECGANGPEKRTEKDAAEAWNASPCDAAPPSDIDATLAKKLDALIAVMRGLIDQQGILDDRVFARMLDCAVVSSIQPTYVLRDGVLVPNGWTMGTSQVVDIADSIIAERKKREDVE